MLSTLFPSDYDAPVAGPTLDSEGSARLRFMPLCFDHAAPEEDADEAGDGRLDGLGYRHLARGGRAGGGGQPGHAGPEGLGLQKRLYRICRCFLIHVVLLWVVWAETGPVAGFQAEAPAWKPGKPYQPVEKGWI